MIERIPITSREQWLGLRRNDVTGSAVGALFNVHPWQTIAGLHAEKCGLELPGPDPNSALIRRGLALEAVVADEVKKLCPEWRITKANEYLRAVDLRLGSTPDFKITDAAGRRGTLQTKVVASWQFAKKWRNEDGEITVPMWIILQSLTEALLDGAEFSAVAALVIGDYTFETHIVEVPRHKATEHKIRVAVHQFWAALDAGIVPAIDPAKDADLLALLYPREREGSIIDLTRDNRAAWLCEERARQGAIIKEAEEAKKAAEVELKGKIGEHEAALIGGWRCTLRTTHREERVQKATSFRVLHTNKIREDA